MEADGSPRPATPSTATSALTTSSRWNREEVKLIDQKSGGDIGSSDAEVQGFKLSPSALLRHAVSGSPSVAPDHPKPAESPSSSSRWMCWTKATTSLLLALITIAFGYSQSINRKPLGSKLLKRHGERNLGRRGQLLAVTDSAVVAVGYGLANCMLVCTSEGLVAIDSLETPEAMREVLADWLAAVSSLTPLPIPQPRADFESLEKQDASSRLPLTGCQNSLSTWRQEGRRRNSDGDNEGNDSSSRPVIAGLIYSHFHADHTGGGLALRELTAAAAHNYDTDTLKVYSSAETARALAKIVSRVAGVAYARGMKQLGGVLVRDDHNTADHDTADDDTAEDNTAEYINAGIGPRFRYNARNPTPPLMPNWTFTGESAVVSIGNFTFELLRAPGESSDQIVVWMPTIQVAFAADLLYRAFPNVAPLRGEDSRDPLQWVASLKMLKQLPASTVVLGHTLPISGREEINDSITAYMDALLFVHDQTLRHLNQGMHTDEIVDSLRLPRSLRDHEFLQESYGAVAWAVRGVADRYLGWFSGDPTDLRPLSRPQKAQRMADLAGGVDKLLTAAKTAFAGHDLQWALDLCTSLKALPLSALSSSPAVSAASRRHDILKLRSSVLRQLATAERTSSGFNWYMTEAQLDDERAAKGRRTELQSILELSSAQKAAAVLNLHDIEDSLDLFSVRWKAGVFKGSLVVKFVFSSPPVVESSFAVAAGSTEAATPPRSAFLHFREAAVFRERADDPAADITVYVEPATWLDLLLRRRSPLSAVLSGDVRFDSWHPMKLFKFTHAMSLVER